MVKQVQDYMVQRFGAELEHEITEHATARQECRRVHWAEVEWWQKKTFLEYVVDRPCHFASQS